MNLGTLERALRFVLGVLLGGWALTQPELDTVGWLTAIAALFLVLNGIFGRCYLWHILDISSCGCNSLPAERLCDKSAA